MNDSDGLKVCVDEMNRNLKLQFEGVDTLKATARSILSAASLITGLMGVLQLSRPPIQPEFSGWYNLGMVVTAVLYMALIGTAVKAIMAITLNAPVAADWTVLYTAFAEKTGPDLAKQQLSCLLNAIKQNAPIIKLQNRLVLLACVLLPMLIGLLFALSLIPRVI